MLPTHVIRMETSNQGATASASSSGGGAAEASSSSGSYPPARNGVAAISVSASSRRARSGVQEAIFGPRGVTALTVDPDELIKESASASSSQQQQPNGHTRANGSASAARLADGTKPSRWGTLEFRFYALVFLIMVPYMIWVPVELSSPKNPNFVRYSRHLRRGWIFGRLRDDSDFQYRTFRDYVGLLSVFLVLSVGASRLVERLAGGAGSNARGTYAPVADGSSSNSSRQQARPGRKPFLLVWTMIFILALHGTNSLKLLLCCSINYLIARTLRGTALATPAIWTFNVATLFAVHYYEGVDLAAIHPSLGVLEQGKGLLTRWQINYNITMLRLVSFSLDYHWATLAARDPPAAAASSSPTGSATLTPRQRTTTSHALSEYGFLNYLIYALYPPLFIAGPIMTFNDFFAQLHRPLRIPARAVAVYAVRFAACLLTMELIIHYMYVNAIKDAKAWHGDTPLQLSMVGFWNLIIVWLKLLLPWRFFRLWAMADGVDAPENMIRCMANNYSTLGFWRSWHRSYNLWIVRYIYVPVGGTRRVVPATFLVFTFVAFWHDLSLRLLAWGWLVALFILPEVGCRALFAERRYGAQWWYRHLSAVGGVLNVLMMMTANLVGFVIGVDGIKYMWAQILGTGEGLRFLLGACATLFVGVQVMFEYREEELRRGVSRKC